MAVGTRPRYSARTPPSSRITLSVIPHMVKSALANACATGRTAALVEEVWYEDASAGCAAIDDGAGACDDCTGMEAVAIDSRDRTRSRGYVVPESGGPLSTRRTAMPVQMKAYKQM